MKRRAAIECPSCHGEGVGLMGRCVRCRGRGLVRPEAPRPACPTSSRSYWDGTPEQRKAVCGDRSGPYHKGVECVCTKVPGHDGDHRDPVAGIEWAGTYCPACRGSGRVKEEFAVDHPGSTRFPREWACEECKGTGRKAA